MKIRSWLSAVGIALVVGLAIYGVGYGLLTWQTANTRFLEPAPASTVSAPAATEVSALDAILDGVGAAATSEVQNRMENQRLRARDGLIANFMILTLIMTVAAAGWNVFAWLQAPHVGVVSTQRLASGAWWTGLIGINLVAVALLWLTFSAQGPAATVTAIAMGGMIGVGLVLIWIGYWLSTAFGAPSVLRASAPFARHVVPLNWGR